MGGQYSEVRYLAGSIVLISVKHHRYVGKEIKFYMKNGISWESVNDNLQAHYHLNSMSEVHKSVLSKEACILILILGLPLHHRLTRM